MASSDGGQSWVLQPVPAGAVLTALDFVADGLRGWAVGSRGTILATTDGGQTWEPQASGTRASLAAVQFLEDGRHGWAVGESGTILATQNGGETWRPQNEPAGGRTTGVLALLEARQKATLTTPRTLLPGKLRRRLVPT